MATTEWLSASTQIQQSFVNFWNKSRQMLVDASARRDDGMQAQQIQGAVAQAAQQAAAKAAAEAIDMAMEQMKASQQVSPQAPQALEQAMAQQGGMGRPQ